MAPDSIPRLRLTGIPEAAVLVVRGDELDPEVLRADASRFRRRFEAWGRYGSQPTWPLTMTRWRPSAKGDLSGLLLSWFSGVLISS